ALLDSYTAPMYISDTPISPYPASLRLLCTSQCSSCPVRDSPDAPMFTPPNLIQLLPAAIMTALEMSRISGGVVLLPS
ncbi:hypothetical protein DACRYDRAFT_42447, partial [Dacryopinax primogenitus]